METEVGPFDGRHFDPPIFVTGLKRTVGLISSDQTTKQGKKYFLCFCHGNTYREGIMVAIISPAL